jgi:hypothetical protein
MITDSDARILLGDGAAIPLWLAIACTLFLCVLVPVYWWKYGPANFLWFSDIALLVSAAALWLESPLLASMMALAVTLPELAWNVGFFGRLIFGVDVTGLAGYMFDPTRPLYLRALSLFHVYLPVLLVWTVHRLGYDRRALAAQTVVALIVLPVTYAVTNPADNINWVYGPGTNPQNRIPTLLYLGLVMLLFPLAIYLPTHVLLSNLFTKA